MVPTGFRGLTNSALRGWAAVAQVRPVYTAAGCGSGERMTHGLYGAVKAAAFIGVSICGSLGRFIASQIAIIAVAEQEFAERKKGERS